jgi:hypothetical protein
LRFKYTQMNFTEYQAYFQEILHSEQPTTPYDNLDYLNYTKLNWSRMNRWLKTGHLTEELRQSIAGISEPQHWIIITEPWCGDAAHIIPFLHMAAELNDKIKVSYELRDSEPYRINDYLTNSKSKSIPKLIIQNNEGKDLAVWGPRPAACQIVYDELHAQNADFETVKTELQHWYNNDSGKEIMTELTQILG